MLKHHSIQITNADQILTFISHFYTFLESLTHSDMLIGLAMITLLDFVLTNDQAKFKEHTNSDFVHILEDIADLLNEWNIYIDVIYQKKIFQAKIETIIQIIEQILD